MVAHLGWNLKDVVTAPLSYSNTLSLLSLHLPLDSSAQPGFLSLRKAPASFHVRGLTALLHGVLAAQGLGSCARRPGMVYAKV